MPRLAPSTTSRASVAPASRSFFGSSKPAAAPATEAQAEAATPDVKAEEAKAAAEAEVKVEDPKLAELEAKVKEHTEKITELTVRTACAVRVTCPGRRRSLALLRNTVG